jgi:hypothetical protein
MRYFTYLRETLSDEGYDLVITEQGTSELGGKSTATTFEVVPSDRLTPTGPHDDVLRFWLYSYPAPGACDDLTFSGSVSMPVAKAALLAAAITRASEYAAAMRSLPLGSRMGAKGYPESAS